MSGSLKWFRVYSDFLNNAKICRLSFIEQRHFIGILALKSSGVLDQECQTSIMDGLVARGLGVGKKKISSLKNRLIDVALIDEFWQPLGWISRQFRSDHDATSAERQRKFREKMKKNRQSEEKRQQNEEKLEEKSYPQIDTIQQDNCESNALCNVLGNAPDTDTDTELKNPPISPQGGEVLSQPSLLVDSEPQRPTVAAIKKSLPSTTKIPSPPPDLVDTATWQAWLDHRRSLKKPVTPNGATMVFKQLDQARQLGHNPNEMLETAIANGWQGCVFEKHRQAYQQETKPNQKSPVPSFRDIPKTNTAYAGSAF